MQQVLDTMSIAPWWVFSILSIALGSYLSGVWAHLFRQDENVRVRNAAKGVASFWGKNIIQLAGLGIAVYLVPWDSIDIPQTFVLVLTIIVGFIMARFDHLIAGLMSVSLIRLGEVIQHNGRIITVTEKTWQRVHGYTPDGMHVSVGHSDLTSGELVNWTRRPVAKKVVDLHVDAPDHNVDTVFTAIDSVLIRNGKPNPDYCVLKDEVKEDSATGDEYIAFRGYAGQAPSSHLYKVGFFSRYVTDLPGLTLQINEELWRACSQRGISLGQTNNNSGEITVKYS